MPTITLYTRLGCHLCEQARDLLAQAGRGAVRIDEIDVDEDAGLRTRYGDRVPVVLIGGRELAWPFTLEQARRAIERAGQGTVQ